jgi:DNA-directed RNA polymerase subunit RPC12/RpoP
MKLIVGKNDLATTHPELAREADGWDPKSVSSGSEKKFQWVCDTGHIWKSSVNSRALGSNCPFCTNNQVLKGYNDLATTHPEIAKEAHGWDPATFIAGTGKKLEWKCNKGHLFSTTGSHRTRGQGCPYCSNKKVLKGFNDLETINPEIAKEAHGWDPATVTVGSGKNRSWKCKIGHVWKTSINARNRGTGCPYCTNTKVLKNFNDLKTINPELAKEAHGWDPAKVVAGTNKKLEWKCSFGHIWEAAPSTRLKGFGCSVCANQKVLSGFNDLKTSNPEIAKEAHGWDPTKVIAGTNKKLEWKCSFGHIWEVAPNIRVSQNQNCPYCSNHQVLKGFNDLATTHPELAKEAHGWDPTKVIAGTNKKLEWKCSFGHIWRTTGGHRTGGKGCPSCAQSGFDPNNDAYLYFLIQPIWEVYQIGITNEPKDRLKKHKRNDFELLELRGPMDGHTAQELERAILGFLKAKKANLSPEHIAGKFDGYTESWTMDSYKVNNLKELIDKASEAGF